MTPSTDRERSSLAHHPFVRFFLWIAAFWLFLRFLEDIARLVGSWFGRVGLFLFALAVLTGVLWLAAKKVLPLTRFFKSLALSVGAGIAANPDIKRIVGQYPRFFSFLKRRTERGNFSGLPLTLLALAFAYTLFLFFGVLDSILKLDTTVLLDTRISNLLFSMRNPDLIHFFLWVTLLANWKIVVALALGASVIFWAHRKSIYIIPLLIALTGSKLFEWSGKLIVRRERPDIAYYYEPSFSFPSGHAALSVALYGFFAYVLFRFYKKRKIRVAILFATFVVIAAVGLSRLYLGVHYWSDVWGGYLLGLLWLIIGISFVEWFVRRKAFSDGTSPFVPKKSLIASIFAFELVFFAFVGSFSMPTPTTSRENTALISLSNPADIMNHVQFPHHTETPDGNLQEPIGLIVIARDDQQFVEAMRRSGWFLADPVNFSSLTQFGASVVLHQSYPSAPITPSFWNMRAHDLGFEASISGTSTVRERHHARFWKTAFVLPSGEYLYAGTASLDNGIKWGGFTHTIDPDIDTERRYLVETLRQSGSLSGEKTLPFVHAQLGRNFTGDYFFTQGDLSFLKIKD